MREMCNVKILDSFSACVNYLNFITVTKSGIFQSLKLLLFGDNVNNNIPL